MSLVETTLMKVEICVIYTFELASQVTDWRHATTWNYKSCHCRILEIAEVTIEILRFARNRSGCASPRSASLKICIEIGRAEFGISGITVFEIYIEFGLGETCDCGTCILEIDIEIGLVEIYIVELVKTLLFEIDPEMDPGSSSLKSASRHLRAG